MSGKFIKNEDGKEVVYEKGVSGLDRRIGELHENLDGSKETRNAFGENVKVERKELFSNEREAEIDNQKGVFSKGFLSHLSTFKPAVRKEPASSNPESSASDYEDGDSYKYNSSAEVESSNKTIKTLTSKVKNILDSGSLVEIAGPVFLLLCGLIGLIYGFFAAGIGGAIAYFFGGVLYGLIIGLVVGLLFEILKVALPWLILGGIIASIAWVVQALWGVGKP